MTTSELENQATELSRQLSSSEVESLASELFDDALVPTHTSSWPPQSDAHRLDEEEEDRENEREAQNSGTSATETENSGLSEKPEQSSNMPHAGGPPAKHGLFSPKLREKRLAVVKKIGISILLMGTLMLTLFSIYWGSFYKRLSYLDRVHLWIVNNDDGDLVGSSFTTIAHSFATAKKTVNVETVDSLTYDEIIKLVQDEHTWGVFYIPANSTSALETALASPSASEAAAYSGADSVRFMYSQARDQLAMGYIVTWVNELERNYTAEFAMQVLSLTTSSSSSKYDLSTIVSDAPHLITRPSSIELENLFPFDNPTATATTQVGLIFIVITSFFQFNFFAPIHALISPELKRSHLIFYRYLSSWVAYFFLSLFYSLVSLAFQMDFTRTFGRAGFVIFWMTNYLGMLSVGIFLENLALICISTFPPILGFGLICTVISNISPAFYSIPLQHRFYRYGYALPIKNLADATRTIMFDTHNTMGRNYGVLVAWIAIDMIMLPFSLNFFGKTMMKRKMAEMKAQAKK
ncbi:hypothetical protein BZA70DRAFT_267977 [Myxozyma melibiosi]|uniref:DUF3533 domain-containing protein n=1 Tax=Myxozyma melibiosi TaxID=54550 RepID=A0ABR1F4J3_9ASCO